MPSQPNMQMAKLGVVGGNQFGRYPKISNEQTWNMIISDGFLVGYAGYLAQGAGSGTEGRGIFSSIRFGNMVAVIDNGVYVIDQNLNRNRIGSLQSYSGSVFMDENDANQIAICDLKNIYIFDWLANTFAIVPDLDFTPGYIAFQDGYFIAPSSGQPQWRISAPNDGFSWPAVSPEGDNVGTFQTKPDNCQACVRVPGKGNMLFVMGTDVTESWADLGLQLFPYQKSTWFNIDYGCINPATIAFSQEFVIWIGGNEKSGLVINYSDGGSVKQISTDGLNFKLANLTAPSDCYGFMFKQDGHLIYQFTFKTDNLSYIYDFNTQTFFSVCDENMDYHIARKVVIFNNKYYFISFNDGNIYEFSSDIYTLNGATMQHIRICPNFRLPNAMPFIVNNINLTMEQGNNAEESAIDMSVSRDGGATFGNQLRKTLNRQGLRKNIFRQRKLGRFNDMVTQFKFWSEGRFVVGEASFEYYQ